MTISAHSPDDRALDPRLVCARYADKSWMTMHRWRNDPEIGFPKPDFYVGKTPFFWLSTLQAWEQRLPAESPLKGRALPSRHEAA